jgi:hypothetical protein
MFAFFYGYLGFYFFNDLFILRLINCTTIIINIIFFGYLFWLLGARIRFLVIWAIFLVGLFQISGAGLDPVAGFAFHYPILGIQLSIVFILFIKWYLNKNILYLYCSLAFWLFFMLSYEINFIIIPIAFSLLLFNYDKCKNKFPIFLLISVSCLYLFLNFYFRNHSSGGGYQGSAFSFSSNIGIAYLKQLTSSLPLISYSFITHNLFPTGSLFIEMLSSYFAWLIFIFSFVIFIFFGKFKSSVAKIRKEAFIISLGMFMLPAIFPAISLRYQNEVGWGAGTLPVYYQNFGFAFFGAYAISSIPKAGVFRIVLPILMSVYLATNFTINLGMVKVIDKLWREPRDIFAFQAQSGLFSQVQDGDIIHVKNVNNYINSNLIFQWSGKRIFIPTDDHFWFPEAPSANANSFELSYSISNRIYMLTPAY